ncbi:BTAD domain-containing putative transcriptional regulator [Streptomyces sp. SID3212]|uniref:BTAD domain-containing putative transcriptional regulator n=1 Tax=Streptomyces sp. SID3212 TaxID=2690259 RepID=UPI001F378B96|nr:BTAD domain-containing putative transcriptional regulator [Streptomyces sp. SID3212]
MEVDSHDGPLNLGGTKQRATLAFLLLQANRVVPTSQLLNALWGVDDAPTTSRKILQNAVYGLRGILSSGSPRQRNPTGTTALLTQPPGYMMRVEPEQVDLHRFHTWVEEGREKMAQGASESAASLLHDALALWRGPALADLVEAGIEWPELVAVQRARLDVMEDYFDTQLACGRHHVVLAELEAMVKAQPLKERSCGQLMLALYRCGRQADALNVYSRIRTALVEDLGLEPGHGLQRLQQAILAQEPELSLAGPVSGHPFGAAGDSATRERLSTTSSTRPIGQPAGVRVPRPGPAAPPDDAGPEQLRVSRHQVAVVSIRTWLAPTLVGPGDEELDDLLNGTAAVVREQVERFDGTVTASIGSTYLALFGLHGPQDNHAGRAVLAALAIRDILDVAGRSGPEAAQLTVQSAVTMGGVLLSRRGREAAPTVVGAVLDESQALLSTVPAGEVLASDAVRQATGDTVSYRLSSTGWQVIGARVKRGDADDAEPCYELDVLRGLMKRTQHRAVPHLVTVLGEPGTGKSRLLGDFEHWVTGHPGAPVVLSGRTPAVTHDNALAAQAQILAAYCGIRPNDDEDAVDTALSYQVRSLFPDPADRERILPALTSLLSTGSKALLRVVCPESVLDIWCEFVRAAVRGGPVVLCIDDLHHATDSVLDSIEALVESVGPRPLFMVASADPELMVRRPGWTGGNSHATTVTLDRPEGVSSEQLVKFLRSAANN